MFNELTYNSVEKNFSFKMPLTYVPKKEILEDPDSTDLGFNMQIH